VSSTRPARTSSPPSAPPSTSGPEQLNRKIEAVTGYPWRQGNGGQDYLTNGNEYRIFYGGIDSNSIVQRITDPNGIMANIALRMANEMSCLATARDFAHDPSDRLLFPYAEIGFVPEDDERLLRPRRQRRHPRQHPAPLRPRPRRVLRPQRQRDHRGLQPVRHHLEGWQERRRRGHLLADLGNCRATNDYWTGADLAENAITQDPDYTVRAWMGVLTYMLSDYKFLHE
jgi:hypothetical protein